jgi:phosphate transport system substrate-binding protein
VKRLAVVLAGILILAGCSRSGSSRALIQNKGSDTLVNVAQTWAEAYKKVNPRVAVAVTGGGSGTGISALINGTVDLANSSRRMSAQELQLARQRGVEPREFVVGYDALAIYLHNNNPIQALTFDQIASIYGEGGRYQRWSDLGVEVPGCSSDEIVRVSRQNNSGTYIYFQEAVLGKRDYKLGSRDMHGSKDVVDLVSKTPCSIGYSGLAYNTPEVHMPCVSQVPDGPCVRASEETALDGSYPISRPLIMYTSGEPEGVLKEYLDWILSDEGQCIIHEKGYSPVRIVDCPSPSSD